MKPEFKITWLDRTVRLTLGFLFILAGIMKLRDPEAFSAVIDAFGLVPGPVSGALSIVLPLLEIIAGAGLVLDHTLSLHTVTALLAIFMVILLYGMHMGLDIDCGCYGPEDVESRAFGGLRTAFHRDLAMAAGLIYLYARRAYNAFCQNKITDHFKTQEV